MFTEPISNSSFKLLMKTHYDVLQVDKDCTAEEIKDSYIKLSKKYHPDKNKNFDAHKNFVAVNEAYSVLGKKDNRFKYDACLMNNQRMSYERATNSERMHYTNYYNIMQKANRKGKAPPNYNAYFTSRKSALVCCCLLMAFGAGIQLIHAWREKKHRFLVNYQAAMLLHHSKIRAHKLGREQAIQDFASGKLKGVTMGDVEEELNENSHQNCK